MKKFLFLFLLSASAALAQVLWPVDAGGTGAATAVAARTNLGLGSGDSVSFANGAFTGYLTFVGTNPGGLGGSRNILDWNSGGGRWFSYGGNDATAGTFLLLAKSSAESVGYTVMSSDTSGNVTFGQNATVNGNATVGGTVNAFGGATASSSVLTVKQTGTTNAAALQMRHANNAMLGHLGWSVDGATDAVFLDSDSGSRPLLLNTRNNGPITAGTGLFSVGGDLAGNAMIRAKGDYGGAGSGAAAEVALVGGVANFWGYNRTSSADVPVQLGRSGATTTISGSNVTINPGGEDVLTGGNIIQGASKALYWSGRSFIASDANANLRLSNNSGGDFGLLQFGGTTSFFPALKRSGAALLARLADDSGNAEFAAGAITANGNITATKSSGNTSAFVIDQSGVAGWSISNTATTA